MVNCQLQLKTLKKFLKFEVISRISANASTNTNLYANYWTFIL